MAGAGAGSAPGGGLFWLHPIRSAVAADSSNTLNALAFIVSLCVSFTRKRDRCALRAQDNARTGIAGLEFSRRRCASGAAVWAGTVGKLSLRHGSSAAFSKDRNANDTPTGPRPGCRAMKSSPYLRSWRRSRSRFCGRGFCRRRSGFCRSRGGCFGRSRSGRRSVLVARYQQGRRRERSKDF